MSKARVVSVIFLLLSLSAVAVNVRIHEPLWALVFMFFVARSLYLLWRAERP